MAGYVEILFDEAARADRRGSSLIDLLVKPIAEQLGDAAGIEYRKALLSRFKSGANFAEGSPQAATVRGFNATPQINVDPASIIVLEAARVYEREKKVSFGEAIRAVSPAVMDSIRQAQGGADAAEFGEMRARGGVAVDPTSVIFAEAAKRKADSKNIDFGSALRQVYAESAAAESSDIVVASAENGQIVLNAGSNAGIQVGDRFALQRLQKQVSDPVTGEIIRKIFVNVGDVEVTEVDAKSAMAKSLTAGKIEINDVAVPAA